MLPKFSSDAYNEDRAAFRRNVRLVRHTLIFLSVLIFFNLVFFFRAIYYFHNPIGLPPYTPDSHNIRTIIPEIGGSAFSTEKVSAAVREPTTTDIALRSGQYSKLPKGVQKANESKNQPLHYLRSTKGLLLDGSQWAWQACGLRTKHLPGTASPPPVRTSLVPVHNFPASWAL